MLTEQKYKIVTTAIVPSDSCSKATLLSSTIISNNVEFNFTMSLTPSTMYTLFVFINGVISKQQSFQSLEDKSGSVVACNVANDFGSNRLQIMSIPPSSTNGQILEYNVWLQDTSGTCINQWTITTSNYGNAITGDDNSSNKQCFLISSFFFNYYYQRSATKSINPPIASIINHAFSKLSNNDKICGNISSTSFLSSQYYPTVVNNFQCVTQSYNYLSCFWQPPYMINNLAVNYTIGCNELIAIINSLSDTVSNDMVSSGYYHCIVTTCSSVGCKSSFQSGFDISSKMSANASITLDHIEVTRIMSSSFSSSTSFEIPITLPFSLLTNYNGRITSISVVVCINGKFSVENSSNRALEKTYVECDKGYKCPYVISLDSPIQPYQRKRDTYSNRLTNQPFTIGNSYPSESVNGPLAAGSTYLIGLRICNIQSCVVVKIVKSTTPVSIVPIVASVTVILLVIIIICVIVAARIWLNRRKKRQTQQTNSISLADVIPPPDYSLLPAIITMCPVIDWFSQYYQSLIHNANMKASEQFLKLKEIESTLQNGDNLTLATDQDMKNRYINIRPYKHNIIKLEGQDDYINASRICLDHCCLDSRRACDCKNYYIATQGPIGNNMEGKTQTMGDFWKMVLQYNVSMIIDLTKCVENGKENCAQYWPVLGIESYVSGESTVNVEVKNNITNQSYEERTFLVSIGDTKQLVTQLHFTDWNDYSCPDIEKFFEFFGQYIRLKEIDQPVLVHCSAGVGRTGTFILIDIMVNKINNGARIVDIYDTLLKLRQCRVSMVETEKQYIFVHEIIDQYLQKLHLAKDHYITENYNNAYQNMNDLS